jgi:hypothetical protein
MTGAAGVANVIAALRCATAAALCAGLRWLLFPASLCPATICMLYALRCAVLSAPLTCCCRLVACDEHRHEVVPQLLAADLITCTHRLTNDMMA